MKSLIVVLVIILVVMNVMNVFTQNTRQTESYYFDSSHPTAKEIVRIGEWRLQNGTLLGGEPLRVNSFDAEAGQGTISWLGRDWKLSWDQAQTTGLMKAENGDTAQFFISPFYVSMAMTNKNYTPELFFSNPFPGGWFMNFSHSGKHSDDDVYMWRSS